MIKIGLIGTGGISGAHLDYLKSRKDVRIAALCDIKPEALKKRQKQYGGRDCRGFYDYREMLAKVPLDAVWICTPPLVRKELLIACADRKLPTFCEKPVEHDPIRGRAIAAALARRQAKVQIGYVLRYAPAVSALRQAMRDDKIHLVQSYYGCNVSLTMGLRAWFYDMAKSGGALVDQATHNLDLLRYLFGEIREVQGLAANPVHRKARHYTIDETIVILFKFRNGILGSHNHSWVANGWRNEILISGEKRLYRINLNSGILTVNGPPPHQARAKAKHTLIPDAGSGDAVWFKHDGSSIFRYEDGTFLKQVSTGNWSGNLSDYADGLKTLELTLACNRALVKGKVSLAS
jgi:predicted dehydrogenase